jgi:tetratricopeptide (TPR) repeat protein
LVLLVAFVVVIGGGFWLWKQTNLPRPPKVDTTGREPEIAAVIHRARTEVLQNLRSAGAWGRLGLVLLAHDYEAEARVCLTRAQELDSKNPRWVYLNGRLLEVRDPAASLPLLRRAAGLAEQGDDLNVVPRLFLAETLFRLGHSDEAAESFRRVLAERPNHPRAYLGLGQIAYQQGDLVTALEQARRAAAAVPKMRSIHAFLAEIYRRQGNSAAEKKEMALLPGCADKEWPDPDLMEIDRHQAGSPARILAAKLLLAQGQPGQASALLSETVAIAPESFRARLFFGQVLSQQGNLEAAEEQLRAALKLHPDQFEALGELGVVLQHRENYKEAAEVYRRVLALKAGHALAHFNLAHCQEKLGDRPGALASLQAAVKHKPEFAWAHQVLGKLLLESGQIAAASEHLHIALDLDPDNRETKELLAKLPPPKRGKK